MESVQLESNYQEARALGIWFALSLLVIGIALFFVMQHRDQLQTEHEEWSMRYQNSIEAQMLIKGLDASARTWMSHYNIDQQRADQATIDHLETLVERMGVASLGNLNLNEGLAASKRYWVSMSEYALQQNLLRNEAGIILQQLLNEAAEQKPSAKLIKIVTRLPEEHRSYLTAANDEALAAITRSVASLTALAPTLSKHSDKYMGLIERAQLLREGLRDAVSELQAVRHERQFDLTNMLGASNQQASARLTQIDGSASQAAYGFYALMLFVAALTLFRVMATSRKMRIQARQLERNQAYMLERVTTSEANEKAKTSFLSVLSYEARTALDSILGLTRLAQHSATNPDQQAKLDEVIASSTSLNTLLDDVLNFIDIELGSIRLDDDAFSPKDVLAMLVSKYSEQASNKHILFEVDIDPSLSDVYLGDQKRFYQALDYLICNAVSHTEKGHVIFTLSVDSGQTLSQSVQRLNIRIEDTGMALSKDEAAELFDPFSTATFKSSRKSGGAGVRLSTVSRLVTMMDGEVEVESSKGHGVTFNLYLHLECADPGTQPISTSSLEDTAANHQVDLQHLKVLVVEDNLTNSSLLKWILEDLEHEVDVAENGVECLNRIESKDYDLILMDQHMPEMDGEEATKRIRAREDHKAATPIVGCTADAFQETRDLLISAGQQDVILKPISTDSVFEITQNLLAGQYRDSLAAAGEASKDDDKEEATSTGPEDEGNTEPKSENS